MDGTMEEFDSPQTNIDELLTQLGGCGRFQMVMTFFVSWVKIVASMSMIFMVFGNYDPGWQCVDNSTSTNVSSLMMMTAEETDSNETDNKCHLYARCNDVQFTAGISTVVSQWELVCNRSWIPSLIISIQMVGVLVGAYLSGYFGDRFGRKRAIYASTVYHAVVNIIAIFSNSWQMFAVLRFFIGIGISLMMYPPNVLALEFVPAKWRNVIFCFPLWAIGALIFTVAALATENWRYLHGVIAASSFIVLLPCYWMPESLRWLTVNDRMPDALDVVKSMADLNNKSNYQGFWILQQIANRSRRQSRTGCNSCISLLRKDVRYPTFALGVVSIFMIVIYYAITFSVKSLSGNFYTNLCIMFASEIPMSVVSSILPNYTGRKISIILFEILSTMCLFIIVGLHLGAHGALKSTGILVNALLARVFTDASWDIMITYVGELYPTLIRSTSVAYINWIARIGGILAPYLIPDDPDSLYINYLIMAVCAFICCCLIIFLQETKDKALKETWEITVEKSQQQSENDKP